MIDKTYEDRARERVVLKTGKIPITKRLTLKQKRILKYLRVHRGCFIKDIANSLSNATSTVYSHLTYMEKKGYVTRKKNVPGSWKPLDIDLANGDKVMSKKDLIELKDFRDKRVRGHVSSSDKKRIGTSDYFICKNGDVISHKFYRARKLVSSDDTHGYLKVTLSTNGKRVIKKIHRLLAIAFIPNPKNYKCINHKDGNKRNNSLDNLEWCTYGHNMRHAFRNKLIRSGEKHEWVKLRTKEVLEIKQKYGSSGISYTKLGQQYGVCGVTIGKIIRRENWKYLFADQHV